MKIQEKISWRTQEIKETQGVLVGCDENQEWLLSWWWSNFISYNNLPVSFIDFGMSDQAVKWCRERGEVIPFPVRDSFITEKKALDSNIASAWEKVYGDGFWSFRLGWFKKPLALLLSPYSKTLWLDLDCEVIGSISSLFDEFLSDREFALAREPDASQGHQFLLPGEILYNSGVLLYRHGSPLISEWAEEVYENNHRFWSDQHALSRLIYIYPHEISELPSIYNWRMSQGLHINAVIVHWVGSWGKKFILQYGGLDENIKKFLYTYLR